MKVVSGTNQMRLEKGIPDLSRLYPAVEFAHCADNRELPSLIADADVYLGWLDREAFAAGRRLKWIQSPSSIVDHYLMITELAQSDVLLTSASGTHGASLAESALAMILAFTRGVHRSILAQQQRRWAFAGRVRGRSACASSRWTRFPGRIRSASPSSGVRIGCRSSSPPPIRGRDKINLTLPPL